MNPGGEEPDTKHLGAGFAFEKQPARKPAGNNSTEQNMNTLTLKGNWNVVKGKLKQKWASLTDDDLRYVEGAEEELIGRIQKRTGQRREAIERALRDECGCE